MGHGGDPGRAMLNPGKYIAAMLGCFAVAMAAAWWGAASYRQSYSGFEYGIYKAKLEMIARCDTGEVIVLGDSRAGIAFSPAEIGSSVRNFAFNGMSPVEGYFVTRRVLACPHKPKVAIVAFSPNQLRDLSWFWSRGVQLGAVTEADLTEIAAESQRLGDDELYHSNFGAEPPPAIKNWAYTHAFPVYDFSVMLGSLTDRTNRGTLNEATYRQVLADRGQSFSPVDFGCTKSLALEAKTPRFTATKLTDAYFRKLIGLFQSNGVRVIIAPLPYSRLSAAKITPQFARDYREYLASVTSAKPGVTAIEPAFLAMDDCLFADEMHLNRAGTAAYSQWVKTQVLPSDGKIPG